jgi:hypothetical protein
MLRRCGPPAALVLALVVVLACGCSSDEDAAAPPTETRAGAAGTGQVDTTQRTGSIRLVDQPWICRGNVDLDLVKVEMKTVESDSIYLREGCTGRIGKIEIDTWKGDGLKVNVPPPAAHDLVVEGGYIRCYAQGSGGHQDGIQAMGGERITFENLEINCNSHPNAQFYVSALEPAMPTDIVCDGCFLGSGAAQTLFVEKSVRSGARDTLICPGRYKALRVIESLAQDPVLEGIRELPADDERCSG